ncbi:MAG: RNA polymerase sigma factor [Alphaproteobacteria bacterium]|nr:RNA polymerase sigma factor [Alphaproteobacteria bacterium]
MSGEAPGRGRLSTAPPRIDVPDDPSPSDRALLERAAAGDRAAFRAFVARHRGPVWRLLRATCGSEQSAEDALQETFLAVHRAAGSFQGDADARAWLFGIARRQAARTWRRRAGEPLAAEPLDDAQPLAALGASAGWGGDPERVVAAAEDRRRLQAALATLSSHDQEVIVLRDLEGLTGPEAAAALGIPLAAVKTRLHRARLRLMAALQAPGAPA